MRADVFTVRKSRPGIRQGIAAIAVASTLVAGALVAAPAAHAADGYCGYYSASRATNSKVGCKLKQYQSQVKEGTRVHYGPWASYGQTSWQSANYANVAWFTYAIRTP